MKKNKEKKEYVVIGLGRFGREVARRLESNGNVVLAIDNNPKKVDMISEYVTHAVCLDITATDAVAELGLSNFDCCIIAIGHSLEAASFAVIQAKQYGIKRVICKAYDEMQGKILTKIGADEIVYPEREMGRNLANELVFGQLLETVELSSDYSIAEVPVLKEWIGKSLADLRLREKYKLSVIAVKCGHQLEISPPAAKPFKDGDIMVLLGANETLTKFIKKI